MAKAAIVDTEESKSLTKRREPNISNSLVTEVIEDEDGPEKATPFPQTKQRKKHWKVVRKELKKKQDEVPYLL